MLHEMPMPRLSRKLSMYSFLSVGTNMHTHLRISRKAAMTAHPDKGGSESKMAAVNEAYEVLSNPGEPPY